MGKLKLIKKNKIHYGINCMKCEDGLRLLKSNSIDLVVTSPPYDDLRGYNNDVDYDTIVKELHRVVKDGGVVVWIVNDKTHKGSKTLTSFNHCLLFKECGFNVNDVMIWRKTNPMPQVKQPRYNQCFEFMFIFSKGKPKTFNPLMVDCKCANKKYASTCKKITKDKERVYKEFNVNKQKVKDNIWEISIAQNKTAHPAVFPEQLVLDHILSWSNEGDTVLDIFSGSGTTHKVALSLNRKFIGFELSKDYVDIEKKRIKESGLWCYDTLHYI